MEAVKMLNVAAPLKVRPARHLWRAEEGRCKLTWDGLETLSMDACLRPLAWSQGGKLYRAGLDGVTLEIEREPDPVHKMHFSRRLTPSETFHQLELWGQRVAHLAPPWEARAWVEHVLQSQARFRQIYRPVSILPPDQYRALVLQLSEGCPWNRCHFCDLYRDRSFRVKSLADFVQHCEAAISFFGEALVWRRGIFLGDGNTGLLPNRQLVPVLEWLRQRFPTDLKDVLGNPRHPLGFEHVSAFVDTFSGRPRSLSQWRELHRLGLQQLHLGVESGSPEILKLLGKPSQPERVAQIITRLKEAGIAVSIILMLGVGGEQGAEVHENETIKLLRRLPLDGADRVYLSELLIHPGGEYARLAQEQGLREMTRPQCREQAQRLRAAVAPGPLVSLYDVRQFAYH